MLSPRQAMHAQAVQIQFLVFDDITIFWFFPDRKFQVRQALHLPAFAAGKVRMAMLRMSARAHGKMPYVVLSFDPVRYVFSKKR
jgi:hypothetical protein